MEPPVIVERANVRSAISYAVKRALHILRIGGHWSDREQIAYKIADQVVDHFDLCKWKIQRPPTEHHSTHSGPRYDDPAG